MTPERRTDPPSTPLSSPSPGERWARVSALVDAALELPLDDRPAFVRAIGDARLREVVARLLAACARAEEGEGVLVTGGAASILAPPNGGSSVRDDSESLLRRVRSAVAGRYEVEREIGRGGMAIVYLARDPRHDRRVALKVVRPDLAAAVIMERFLQEIRIAAQLNHPHVVTLLDSGEADGLLYYAMPFVDGETLKQRIAREGTLPLKDALRFAREVADALDHAHRHGVVHRDVKPDNILLNDGQAVITDFGIARAIGAAAADPLTLTGFIVGTAEYMSPEQVAGEREIDGRSDVFSLGCVLYAMLTGRPPFVGPTTHAVMVARTTRQAPSVREVRPELPEPVERVVSKALAIVPADRFPTAGELSSALEGASAVVTGTHLGRTSLRRTRRRQLALIGVSSVLVVAATAILWGVSQSRPPVVSSIAQLTHEPGLEFDPDVSPDGKLVAFAAGPLRREARLFTRPADGGRAIALTDSTIRGATSPRWSPDGHDIAFETDRGIFIVQSSGGLARWIAGDTGSVARPSRGMSSARTPDWSPDGRKLAFASDTAILEVAVAGGEPRVVMRAVQPSRPRWSPDGRSLAYVVTLPESTAGRIGGGSAVAVVRVGADSARTLTDSTSWNGSPVWMPDGRSLLFTSDRGGGDDIYWLRLRRDGSAAGEPVRLTTGSRARAISLSKDGRRLAYSSVWSQIDVSSIEIDVGRTQSLADARPVAPGVRGDQSVFTMATSPDGRTMAFESTLRGNRDIYRMPLTGGEPDRLTDSPADDIQPSWSPDGRRIAFISLRDGSRSVFIMNADGSGQRRVVTGTESLRYPDWSPDGAQIVFASEDGVQVIARDPAGGFGPPRRLTAARAYMARWSPDGRRIAFVGDRGALQLLALDGSPPPTLWPGPHDVAPPGFGPTRGARLAWSRDGRTLFYRSVVGPGRWSLWAVPVSGATPRPLFVVDDGRHHSGDVLATDGRRLYFGVGQNESDIWTATLRRR